MFQVPLFFTCIISSNLWNSLIKIVYFYNSSFIENWEKWDAKKFNNPLRVTQQLNWQQDSALIISVSFCKHLMSTGTFALRIITLRIFAIMTHKSFWPKSVSQLKPCHHKFSCVGQLLKPPCVHDSPSNAHSAFLMGSKVMPMLLLLRSHFEQQGSLMMEEGLLQTSEPSDWLPV